ncbi:PilZ domain-containing protein [uncultured Marinobacter sp.]|uniref:PilZ domain-containing protein n=1 Tax=uncultured Marinobacter sp. TaxID=187379 RepID=UPI0030DDC7BE
MGKPLNVDSGNVTPVRVKPRSSAPCLRDQQRVDASLSVQVHRPGQSPIECLMTNLSRSGMMVSCDAETIDRLVPSRRPPAPGDWIDVSARFEVPVISKQSVLVSATCHLAHLRRVSRNEFQLGIRFVDFQGRGFDYVDQYVHRLLADRAPEQPTAK